MKPIEHLWEKLTEELSEMIQAIAKIQHFGPDNVNPDAEVSRTNLEHFLYEMSQSHGVMAMINRELNPMVLDNLPVDMDVVNEKIDKVVYMGALSYRLGRLQLPDLDEDEFSPFGEAVRKVVDEQDRQNPIEPEQLG